MAEKNILSLTYSIVDTYCNRRTRKELTNKGYAVKQAQFCELQGHLNQQLSGAIVWTGSENVEVVLYTRETIEAIQRHDSSLPIVAIVADVHGGNEYLAYRKVLDIKIPILAHIDPSSQLLASCIDEIISKRN